MSRSTSVAKGPNPSGSALSSCSSWSASISQDSGFPASTASACRDARSSSAISARSAAANTAGMDWDSLHYLDLLMRSGQDLGPEKTNGARRRRPNVKSAIPGRALILAPRMGAFPGSRAYS